jgi:hypothetical protein
LPRDLERKFEHGPHCREVCFPTFDRWSEFVINNYVVIVPHPPYSPDIAHNDFVLFFKLKLKLKGRRFETV